MKKAIVILLVVIVAFVIYLSGREYGEVLSVMRFLAMVDGLALVGVVVAFFVFFGSYIGIWVVAKKGKKRR